VSEWSADNLQECSFGGFVLHILEADDSESRRIGTHEYPNRSGARSRDTGGEQRSTRVTIVFMRHATMPEPIRDFLEFRKFKSSGQIRRFIHPVTGAYDAVIQDFTWSQRASPVNHIEVNCLFLEAYPNDFEELIFDVVDLRAGSNAAGGVEATRNAKAALDRSLLDVGKTSSLDPVALAKSWQTGLTVPSTTDPTVTATTSSAISARQVSLELNRFNRQMDQEIDRLEVLSDVRNQPALSAYFELASAIRGTADVVVRATERITELTTTEDRSVLSICAELYGSLDAVTRAAEMLQLNSTIRNPALIPAGTVLVVRSPD